MATSIDPITGQLVETLDTSTFNTSNVFGTGAPTTFNAGLNTVPGVNIFNPTSTTVPSVASPSVVDVSSTFDPSVNQELFGNAEGAGASQLTADQVLAGNQNNGLGNVAAAQGTGLGLNTETFGLGIDAAQIGLGLLSFRESKKNNALNRQVVNQNLASAQTEAAATAAYRASYGA